MTLDAELECKATPRSHIPKDVPRASHRCPVMPAPEARDRDCDRGPVSLRVVETAMIHGPQPRW